jgi:hypothetical protein
VLVFIGDAQRDLVQIRAADDDRARVAQPPDDRRITPRGEAGAVDPRTGRRGPVAPQDQVLDRDRDAGQWSGAASGDGRVNPLGVTPRGGVQGDERVEPRVQRRDALERAFQGQDRRDLTSLYRAGDVARRVRDAAQKRDRSRPSR